jgi:hypothetical protein
VKNNLRHRMRRRSRKVQGEPRQPLSGYAVVLTASATTVVFASCSANVATAMPSVVRLFV